jgi:hypothetical protein
MSLLGKRDRDSHCETCKTVYLVNRDGAVVDDIDIGVAVISMTGEIHGFTASCEETPQIAKFARAIKIATRGRCSECGRH